MGEVEVSVIVEAFRDVPGMTSVDTLRALAEQDYPQDGVEVIVAQYGWSDEEKAEVMRRYPHVRVIEAQGPGYNRLKNAGVRAARGKVIAFADSDTLPARGWLASLMATMAAGADVSVGLVLFRGNSLLRRLCSYFLFCQMLRRGRRGMRSFNMANVAFRADLIRANPLDERLTRPGASIEIAVRLAKAGARLVLSPGQISEHTFYGFHRHTWQFAIYESLDLLETRERQPAAPFSGLVRRLPWAAPPVLAAALFVSDLHNFAQNWRYLNLRLWELPVLLLASLALRTFEVPVMYRALMDREGVRAFVERNVR